MALTIDKSASMQKTQQNRQRGARRGQGSKSLEAQLEIKVELIDEKLSYGLEVIEDHLEEIMGKFEDLLRLDIFGAGAAQPRSPMLAAGATKDASAADDGKDRGPRQKMAQKLKDMAAAKEKRSKSNDRVSRRASGLGLQGAPIEEVKEEISKNAVKKGGASPKKGAKATPQDRRSRGGTLDQFESMDSDEDEEEQDQVETPRETPRSKQSRTLRMSCADEQGDPNALGNKTRTQGKNAYQLVANPPRTDSGEENDMVTPLISKASSPDTHASPLGRSNSKGDHNTNNKRSLPSAAGMEGMSQLIQKAAGSKQPPDSDNGEEEEEEGSDRDRNNSKPRAKFAEDAKKSDDEDSTEARVEKGKSVTIDGGAKEDDDEDGEKKGTTSTPVLYRKTSTLNPKNTEKFTLCGVDVDACKTKVNGFLDDTWTSDAALLYNNVFVWLTMLSVLVPLVPAALSGENITLEIVVAGVEMTLDTFFGLEVLIRYFASTSSKVFLLSLYNQIDLIATTPLFFRLSTRSIHIVEDTLAFYICAVVGPVLRVLKVARRFEKFHLLQMAFWNACNALSVLFYVLTVILLFFSSLLYAVEERENVDSYSSAMWLATMSMFTVGFGDIVPVTRLGQIVVSSLVIFNSLYMAIPIGMIGYSFSVVWKDRNRILMVQHLKERIIRQGHAIEDIPHIFALFDDDGNGQLDIEEFKKVLEEMEVDIPAERVEECFGCFDDDKSGFIDSHEFVRVIRSV